jgi:hypothetical protein
MCCQRRLGKWFPSAQTRSNLMEHFMQWPVLTFVGMVVVFASILATVAVADTRNN